MTETKPEGFETKTAMPGYVPAPVPFDNGMADGLTPGTSNTPGPYVTPDSGEDETGPETSTGAKSARGASATKTTAAKPS